MHHHARWLVNDGQIVVLVNDVESDVFGQRAQRWSMWRENHSDLFFAITLQSQRCFRSRIIHPYLALRDELLATRSGNLGVIHFRKLGGEILIEALSGGIRRRRQSEGEVGH